MGTSKTTASHNLSVCTSSPDCVKVLNDAGNIVSFNEDGLRIMEIDHFDQVRNIHWPELWPTEVRALASDGLAAAKLKGVATFKAPCPTAKGNLKWWDVTIAAVPGEPTTFVVVSKDITEQKSEEMARDLHRQRLQDISDSNTDVLWEIDLLNDLVWWSDSLQKSFGYRPDEIGKDTMWCQDLVHPDDRSRVVAGMTNAVENGSSSWEDEFRFRVADGSFLTVMNRGSVIRDSKGVGVRFVGVMQDVSKRNANARLNQLIAGELSHRVNNILAVTSALFHQSLKMSDSLETLGLAFSHRLIAMARANKAIMRGGNSSADLHSLVDEQLGPFIGSGRVIVNGHAISLGAEVAIPFALTLNELATNAIKHGALSNESGIVAIDWHALSDTSIAVEWVESGGPVVKEPTRKGLGSALIQRSIPKSQVTRRFDPEGFSCAIVITRV